MTGCDLPDEITSGADVRGNEYGWSISSFPDALVKAKALGFACIGGQFQFRLSEAICEMYWLAADPEERQSRETWFAYWERSCAEVLTGFEAILRETDFASEASHLQFVRETMEQGLNPLSKLVFVAYFVDEAEWTRSSDRRRANYP
jgi:hypothetical protein